MRVAIVSRTDSSAGGAGKVAEDLFNLINQESDGSADLWCGFSKRGFQGEGRHALYRHALGALAYRGARYLSRGIGVPDFLPLELVTSSWASLRRYDLYHFHSISAAISPVSVRRLGSGHPVVWTFHDCSPFTGGCIYPDLTGCDAFTWRCGRCPQLRSWPMFTRFDLTGVVQDYKRSMALERTYVPVAPSRWLAETAVRSGMFEEEPVVIPNCVDTEVFAPAEKAYVRKVLGVPDDSFVVLLNAAFLNDERKGVRFAVEALERLKTKPYVIMLGANCTELERRLRFPIECRGYIKNKEEMARYYCASDVFLFPTLADNLPLAAIESIACGTPVVGFRSGGLPEIIEHDMNGWLVEQRDVGGLCEGLELARGDLERRRRWGEWGVQKVLRNYRPETFLQRHLDLYEDVRQRWKGR